MTKRKKEFSKVITATVVGLFSFVAIAFIIFVCYEMHRQRDLSPVGYIGIPIVGLLVTTLGFYKSRAKAKSITDLEWEMTRRATALKKENPDAYARWVLSQVGADVSDNQTDNFNGGAG